MTHTEKKRRDQPEADQDEDDPPPGVSFALGMERHELRILAELLAPLKR